MIGNTDSPLFITIGEMEDSTLINISDLYKGNLHQLKSVSELKETGSLKGCG